MKKAIIFIKKYKIFVFLILILLILIILRLLIKPEEQLKKEAQPPSLDKERELVVPEEQPAPEEKPRFLEKESSVSEPEIPYDPTGEALKEVLEERPWLLDLPIVEKNYTIDYLEDKGSFRVLMRINITSSLSREEQINKIKTEAPQKLEAIGVDLNQEEIYYTFTP
jgi:hypothetical protein